MALIQQISGPVSVTKVGCIAVSFWRLSVTAATDVAAMAMLLVPAGPTRAAHE
jgi:hypothetical protein